MDGTRAALVVAANEFSDPKFQRLRSPVQDVEHLAGVLGDDAIGGFQVATVLNQANAVVQQELERFFSGRKPDDLLLLYFSCHGVKDPTGRLYFVTSNTTFDLLRSTGVSASFVSEQMEYSRSKRIVVLLDCCYSGAFLKGFRTRGDDSVAVEQLEGRGRAVITASRATEYAFEADQLTDAHAQPSMFTGAIVEGLASGRADTNGDGLVTVDELYDYVYDAVRGKVAGQTPGRWIDVEGDLIVARNPKPTVRPAVLPAELQRAVDSDAALQRLGAVSELVQWYRGGDAARQLAALPVLEQLSRDYDERVKQAAAAVLAPPTVPGDVGPSAPGRDEPRPVPADRAPPSEKAVAVPSRRHDERIAGDAVVRSAGWLAAIGAVAVLISPYVTYLRFDGYDSSLGDAEYYTLGAFAVFGLAAYAASCLVRRTELAATGLAVLVGMLPVAVAECVRAVGDGTEVTDVVGPGAGWFMVVGGFAVLAAAGVLAAVRLRSMLAPVPLVPPAAGHRQLARGGGLIVAGGAIGTAAALGWARAFDITGDGLMDVHPPAQDLTIRLLILSVIAGVGWSWLRARQRSARGLLAATAVLACVVATVFLADESYRAGGYYLRALTPFAVLAIGATLLTVLSTIAVPRRLAVAGLAAWSVSSVAWVPTRLASDIDAELLGLALLASGALAGTLAALRTRADHVPH